MSFIRLIDIPIGFAEAIEADSTNPLHVVALADWLEERGDERCVGLRWLVARGACPEYDPPEDMFLGGWLWWHPSASSRPSTAVLPFAAAFTNGNKRPWYGRHGLAFDAFMAAAEEAIKDEYN